MGNVAIPVEIDEGLPSEMVSRLHEVDSTSADDPKARLRSIHLPIQSQTCPPDSRNRLALFWGETSL